MTTHTTKASGAPVLSIVFYILAGLSVLGAIVLAIFFHPGEPDYGYKWKAHMYVPMIVALTAGIMQAALLAAIGSALRYLQLIVQNTKPREGNTDGEMQA